jgi:rhodanese-related sulfurtransferase
MIEDVTPRQVWEALMSNPAATLCDVRTSAEWSFVGLPDLTQTGKQPVLIQWQMFPTMQPNPKFIEALAQANLEPSDHLYFLCRSGTRSIVAAKAARAAGYKHVYNVKDGFEGPQDARGHRGTVAGWKCEGLPWKQG